MIIGTRLGVAYDFTEIVGIVAYLKDLDVQTFSGFGVS